MSHSLLRAGHTSGLTSVVAEQPFSTATRDGAAAEECSHWISLAERADGTVIGYMSWTDNRDVVVGSDPLPGVPLARSDAPFRGDNCDNAGGLDQNIYGIGVTFD